ncbi:MAG TPA: hypothetical protein VK453_10815 [Micromonosporaceae bacterium]|nr:hypothetical protein [Micromonosporaceae bacterium]
MSSRRDLAIAPDMRRNSGILTVMDSTLIATGIGAVAGLVTGLSTSWITLRGARMQADTAMAAQRRQWQAENLRASYSAVITSFRQLMMAWWTLHNKRGGDRETNIRLHDQILACYATFASACATVTLLAPPPVAADLDALRTAVGTFDGLAENMDFVNRKQWRAAENEAYENARKAAEDQHEAFVRTAREELQQRGDGSTSAVAT